MGIGSRWIIPLIAALIGLRCELPLVVLIDCIMREVKLCMREGIGEHSEEGYIVLRRGLDEAESLPMDLISRVDSMLPIYISWIIDTLLPTLEVVGIV